MVIFKHIYLTMFYFSELFYRVLFFSFSFFLTFLVCFFFKEEFLFFIVLPTYNGLFPITYFLFTSPLEAFLFYVQFLFFFGFAFVFPYLCWSFLDFLKSSVSRFEFYQLSLYFLGGLVFLFLFNFFLSCLVLPLVWNFFLNLQRKDFFLISFFFEIKGIDYYLFFLSFFLSLNFSFLCVLFFVLFCFSKVPTHLFFYKSYILTFFLLMATCLSPPEFLSQILLFLFLVSFFEIFILFFLYYIFLGQHLKVE